MAISFIEVTCYIKLEWVLYMVIGLVAMPSMEDHMPCRVRMSSEQGSDHAFYRGTSLQGSNNRDTTSYDIVVSILPKGAWLASHPVVSEVDD